MASRLHIGAVMKPFSMFFSAGLVALLVACSGGSDPTPGTSSSSSSGGGRSTTGTSSPTEESDPTESTGASGQGGQGGPSKPSGATNVACQTTDDCGNWFCDCEDASGRVSPVNARTCNNGWCMDAATACPSACKAFGKTWTGSAGGGPDQ